ncbi:hypothetical protein ACF0H5_023865 [Mactra antiquata]
MASSSLPKMSEETFEYNCSCCANDNLSKEALKYCVECQQYCCQDCLTSHGRISSLKGHSFLDNSSAKSQGQPRTLKAFPTKQCSKHAGMILYMYCESHDAVCCYVCAAEDHKSCKDIVSVSYNIDRLYSKIGTSQDTLEPNDTIDKMIKYHTTLLQQLQESKVSAIKAVSDFRIEMENYLKKLEEVSIREIEDEYKKLESVILEERKRYEDFIDDLKNLKQEIAQASANIAELFVCTKLAEKKNSTIKDDEKGRRRIKQAEIKFIPSEEMKKSIEKMVNLGKAISSRTYNVYKATKVCDNKVIVGNGCTVSGSCIVGDTVVFSLHNKLKRFDILSSTLTDECTVPNGPRGVCKVGDKEVAVACGNVVQFVSVHDRLSLSRSIKMKHSCYGIAYKNGKLYITDESRSLYMYDMSGKLLKTVTSDTCGQPLFEGNRHIIFNDKNDRLFVGDVGKGLVCFNAQCDYIETITDPDVRPNGVCVDNYGNIIVAHNTYYGPIVQCDRDGQTCGVIGTTQRKTPQSVCVHHGLRKMFVGYGSSEIAELYDLTLDSE